MLYRDKKNGSSQARYLKQEPVQKLHRHLAWAIGGAAFVLIINAVVVVALVDTG